MRCLCARDAHKIESVASGFSLYPLNTGEKAHCSVLSLRSRRSIPESFFNQRGVPFAASRPRAVRARLFPKHGMGKLLPSQSTFANRGFLDTSAGQRRLRTPTASLSCPPDSHSGGELAKPGDVLVTNFNSARAARHGDDAAAYQPVQSGEPAGNHSSSPARPKASPRRRMILKSGLVVVGNDARHGPKRHDRAGLDPIHRQEWPPGDDLDQCHPLPERSLRVGPWTISAISCNCSYRT